MTELDLEKLIKNWYQREGEKLPATAPPECPSLTLLWRHVAESAPLEAFEEHVSRCERCRRLIEIIKRENDSTVRATPEPRASARAKRPESDRFAGSRPPRMNATPTDTRVRRRVYGVGGALAAAACIALVLINWPTRSFDAYVVAVADRASPGIAPTALRGGGETEKASPAEKQPDPAWLNEALSDPALNKAFAKFASTELPILVDLRRGNLQLDSAGRITLVDGLDESAAGSPTDLVERDNNACDQIVTILIRHIPGAKEKHRPAIRAALDRWRAENTFRISEPEQ